MSKKLYIAPATTMVGVNTHNAIMAASGGAITKNGDNLEINGYGTSSTGNADSRSHSVWGDDED